MSEIAPRNTTPIACTLDMNSQGERHEEIKEQLFSRQLSVEELPDGYAYRFPGEPEIMQRLAEFVLFERQCCPFFTFELIFEPDQGPATLRLRGPAGTKEFLEGML
jgi:hypothetical protein